MTKPKKTTMKKRKTTTSSSDAPDQEQLERIAQEGAPDASNTATKDEGTPEMGEPAPRKRGRPKGSTSKNAGGNSIPAPLIRAVVALPYSFAAHQWGEHWKLSDPELDSMVEVHAQLAEEYLPDFLKAHPALYGCLFLHALAIIGRVSISNRLEKAREQETAREAGESESERSTDLPGKARFGKIISDESRSAGVPPGASL